MNIKIDKRILTNLPGLKDVLIIESHPQLIKENSQFSEEEIKSRHMKIDKKFEIKLTKEELEDLIKKHILDNQNLTVDDVDFDIESEYGTYGDHNEYHVLKSVTCTGKLE